MQRLLITLLALPILLVSCTDTPTATTVNLGKTTLDQFLSNVGYSAWYNPGFAAFPEASDQATFDAAVAIIAARLGAGEGTYKVIMVTKPNCGCQHTQREMPKVMKTLDAAGFKHENIDVWISDTRLAGLDELTADYAISVAPTFLVTLDGTEIGRIEIRNDATDNADIATDLAAIFVK